MPLNNITPSRPMARFNIPQLLESIAGYKGLPFPAPQMGLPAPASNKIAGPDYQVAAAAQKQTYADNGALLRKNNLLGGYYFMPVVFSAQGRNYEIDCALVSVQLKKNVVSTALVGQRGTVKELISAQDLSISITGCLVADERGVWPEGRIADLRELYDIHDAVSLKCALTDCFFDDDDKVVITDLSFPAANQVEDIVPVSMQCVSDTVFELNME